MEHGELRAVRAGTMMFRRSDVLGRMKRHQAIYRDALRAAEAEENSAWRETALAKLRIVNALCNDILDRCPVFLNPADALETLTRQDAPNPTPNTNGATHD